MNFSKIALWRIILGLLVFFFCLLSACQNGDSPSRPSESATGDLSFSVNYNGAGNSRVQAAVIDCAGEGISTVEAAVYSLEGKLLVRGGPWECDTGQGTISSVPAGGGRILVLLGKNAKGEIILRGEKSEIEIFEGAETHAGIIDCYEFLPNAQAPADGAAVHPDAMALVWGTVTTASEYRVIVSQHSDLSDPFMDVTTTATYYSPTGLPDAVSCYWQVAAYDTYGHASMRSQILSFTVDQNHVNTRPTAQITSPADGSTYAMDDSIRFTGLGSDNQDGDLSGASLMWESDRDGQIGMRPIFDTDMLSIGTHQITLTAIDSEGATDADIIEVNIVTDRPIKVLFAIDCSLSTLETDPDNRRLEAALAFVEQYNILPDVSFEILQWSGDIQDSTMVDGYRGFTKDLTEIRRVLAITQTGSSTDYVGTIEGIYQDIRRDRLNPDNRDSIANTKYIVIFLSDGMDAGETGQPRVDQILNSMDDLAAMVTGEVNASDLTFHTFLLKYPDMTPEILQVIVNLLQGMADRGNGQFHEFESASVIEFIESVEIRG